MKKPQFVKSTFEYSINYCGYSVTFVPTIQANRYNVSVLNADGDIVNNFDSEFTNVNKTSGEYYLNIHLQGRHD